MTLEIAGLVIKMKLTELIFPVILVAAVVVIKIVYMKMMNAGKITRSLNMAVLQVSVSKNLQQREKDGAEERRQSISVMEQLYANLSNIREETKTRLLYGPFYMSFEIATPIDSNEIFFYVGTPKKFSSIVEKQIHSFYPDANIERINDYNIFVPNGGAAGSYMVLKKDFVLPIRTYQNMEADPISGLTSALSKVPIGEGASFQVVMRAAGGVWQEESKNAIKMMQEGKNFEGRIGNNPTGLKVVRWLLDMGVQTVKKSEPEKSMMLTPMQEDSIKAVESKAGKVGFEVNIRLVTSAPTKERAETLLKDLESSFAQYNMPNGNGFKIVEAFMSSKSKFVSRTIYNFIFRNFENSRKCILNTEELTSLFHFPIATTGSPSIKWQKSKQAPPPSVMPAEGLALGQSLFRGDDRVIKMGKEDRRRHMYIIGQTGTGKSGFLSGLVRQDIMNGEGVCVIDPHGDLIEEALEAVPKERAEDVVLFDPSRIDRPMGLNLLEYDQNYPEQKTFVINEMIKVFDKLYDLSKTGGPMFEQYMRNAMLLIMDDPESGSTLIEISKVMSDAEFRKYKLSKCKNMVVRDFWQKEAEKAGGEAALANMVPYITSKLTQFISNDTMRPIIGQQSSSINFREIMDNRKILLVNLSKGKIGETNAYLLGLVLVGKLLISSLSRTDIPQEERKDFYLYIDEFQNFTTDSISTILSEARKYRLCLTLAHQFLGQLPEPIQKSVFGNVGTLCSFRVGPEDAEFLAKQYAPVFDEQDLINIDNYNAYLKLMLDGIRSEGFNMKTYPPVRGNKELADNIKELSMLKYGRDREVVEREILNRANIF
ncbi:MAG: type IV secretion system DNA-binding domain-containing protein [Candidatus Pacebacteria bacterium]|nr:type IV secretion system DNA-binding domain-containing protein [Candidatus Paceibacterota bacterium]